MSSKPEALTIPALVEEMSGRFPDQPVLIWEDVQLSYRDLQREVESVARGLVQICVKRGDKVAILMGNRPEWIISALAICSLGAVMVGVNTWATERELEYILAHSETSVLIMGDRLLKRDYVEALSSMQPFSERLPKLRVIKVVGNAGGFEPYDTLRIPEDSSLDAAVRILQAQIAPDDQAYMLYTSGSSAAPKGVQLHHRPLIENMWEIGERIGATAHDRLWLAVSLFWGLGCENALFTTLTHGGCIVLQESFDAEVAMRLIEKERCTLFYGMSNMAHLIYEHPSRERFDLSSLRSGVTTGTPEQIKRVIDMGVTKVSNVYGMTETYGNSNVTDANDPLDVRIHSVGRPLPGVDQRIVDPLTGVVVGTGEVGEIRLRTRVMSGYYKDPEQTAASWDQHGYFKTGDLGHFDGFGNLYYHGRIKEMIKTGGINVSPLEVEEILMRHPAVMLAYCTGIPDEEREELLVAVIVLEPDSRVDIDELTRYCRSMLAAYKVPRRFCFAERDALPTTSSGKIKKNALASHFFAPDGTGDELGVGATAATAAQAS